MMHFLKYLYRFRAGKPAGKPAGTLVVEVTGSMAGVVTAPDSVDHQIKVQGWGHWSRNRGMTF